MTVILHDQLALERCPHCGIHRPHLNKQHQIATKDYGGARERYWRVYCCNSCGGLVIAASTWGFGKPVTESYPQPVVVEADLPERAREYLQQAIESTHAPDGAVMLASSAVNAMLKEKGLVKGNLYDRINEAVKSNLITAEMGLWAHDIRLEANLPRHANEAEPHADPEDAKRAINFAQALGEFLFVLPARVDRGRESVKEDAEGEAQ